MDYAMMTLADTGAGYAAPDNDSIPSHDSLLTKESSLTVDAYS
jgi:hypothetical protein